MINNTVIELNFFQVLLGYLFIVIILIIIRLRGLNKEKVLIIASIRMTVQLVLVGFILTAIFEEPHPLISLSAVLLMIVFAIFTVFNKFKGLLSRPIKKVIIISLPVGGLVALSYFLYMVIRIEPYYNPQYIIPITGMVIGNSMTGITLGINSMIRRFKDQKETIEQALILGANEKQASHDIINESFDTAIMPTLNNMLGMGIVFLPGMMTGQILAGIAPNIAIMYQIGVMLAILGGVALSTYLFLILGYRTFFNEQVQLISTENGG